MDKRTQELTRGKKVMLFAVLCTVCAVLVLVTVLLGRIKGA